jgi:transcription elongation GreA/GreB family factor
MPRRVFITNEDKSRLLKFISREREFGGGDSENLRNLEREIERASISEPKDMPNNVVTMHSTCSFGIWIAARK